MSPSSFRDFSFGKKILLSSKIHSTFLATENYTEFSIVFVRDVYRSRGTKKKSEIKSTMPEETAMNTSLSQQFITKFALRSTAKIPSCPARNYWPGYLPVKIARDAPGRISAFQWYPNKNSALFVDVSIRWSPKDGTRVSQTETAIFGRCFSGTKDTRFSGRINDSVGSSRVRLSAD